MLLWPPLKFSVGPTVPLVKYFILNNCFAILTFDELNGIVLGCGKDLVSEGGGFKLTDESGPTIIYFIRLRSTNNQYTQVTCLASSRSY